MQLKRGSWLIPIGKTYRGKVLFFNLRGSVPHLAVAGVTGSGKSEFLKLMLYVLCNQIDPWALDIRIIDLKGGATFSAWRHLPHVEAMYSTVNDSLEALEMVVEEMQMRLAAINEARYRFRELPKFRELVVLIDEGGELAPADAVGAEKKLRQRCMDLLSEIVRIGREPGIHVIYATQRPDKNTLPLTIRSQMEARFCFRVKEDYDSEIVLRHKGAEQLPKIPGRMIYQMPDFEQEVQAAYVPDGVVTAWLKRWAGIVDTSADELTTDTKRGVSLSTRNTQGGWGD